MDERTRRNEGVRESGGGSPGGGGGDGLESIRADVQRLTVEADEIFREVMSGDSRQFIRMGRQQGGE